MTLIEGEKSKDRGNLYWIDAWGEGYFNVNAEGHIEVRPSGKGEKVDLYGLVNALIERGIEPPILFRFDGIIRDRMEKIYQTFNNAIKLYDYPSHYQLVYPIKVNQQSHVVDQIHKAGRKHQIGLEVGSKPELLAMLTAQHADDSLLLCNGYKDAEYIELALLSRKLGRRTIIIIEQLYEHKLILDIANELGVEAEVGFRMKPSAKGSGRWASSGGERAKFGLETNEILTVLEELKKHGKTEWAKLLHFHIGSQLSSIVPLKKALWEASRTYVEIARVCPTMEFFDVGGGLGIDYDGSKQAHDSSMNYSMEEYARDIVYAIGTACKENSIEEPIILSESGRALVAHHSLLVTEVIDVATSSPKMDQDLQVPPTDEKILQDFYDTYHALTLSNHLEALHDAHYMRDQALERFIHGDISLIERAYAEKAYAYLIAKIYELSKDDPNPSEEILKMREKLLDIYFCNFSVFQSLPDSWAISQLFPVMPIHRLEEEPSRRATIVDLSCDSDGKIDNFIHPKTPANHLKLHEFDGSPYYLGIFLVGAYQETLGGLHNLFGDTNAVHVDQDEDGDWEFKHLIRGDTMSEVLTYTQYDANDLEDALHNSIEMAVKKKRITNEEALKISRALQNALKNYTYLMV